MFRVLVGGLGVLALAWPTGVQVQPFPDDFRTQEITTDDGATLHLRASGQGPAVGLLHGFGDTGDLWPPSTERAEATARRRRTGDAGDVVPRSCGHGPVTSRRGQGSVRGVLCAWRPTASGRFRQP